MSNSRIHNSELRIIIKGGRVIDPQNHRDEVLDILIEDGRIAGLEAKIDNPKAEVIDINGQYVFPGLVDMHVHLREPGREDEETITSGSRAAAAGGFTAIACMPNTQPVIDSQGLVQFIKSRQIPECRIYPVGAITKGSLGEELAEIGDMYQSGIVGISDDGKPVTNSNLMRRALDYCRMFDIPVISHCEDKFLSADGAMNEGALATKLGLRGIPNAAEAAMAARDVMLADLTGGRVHIAHVSCAETVDIIRRAKRAGIKVTAETCPQYFMLSQEAVIGYDSMMRVNPPLRSKADLMTIIDALKDGTIDCIATDHAPHSSEEKEVEFDQAPCGMLGLETSLGLCWTHLVEKNILTVSQLVEKMAVNPARILKIQNSIEPKAPANLTIFDPKAEWEVDPSKFRSKSRNTPFKGWKIKGKAVMTIVDGQLIKI
ncbi:MAG: dihydroorotase [Candidatus Edwardsbacteria bacterium RIFOXYD12_FULL_50_11]|uniref:Dihydroorotase n=1 Tax=Candidatus Edwardsbacteria bacterium GWF2_54_11 TaxID=1817851 RepID=A0A1F5R425_9BACT|nr:MAG: dihydroorotase [Candidatus Edwardsbacteria bacterium RifOxyC12_full_54_24]OGF08362.1 MAG: dihydroorotase [Candidatus Edwardsbacteria bacterium RifOxyA12_full_54_48]OGF09225.1 MAG: dihydroorotase [Candidatus Edwardsbacteria bacterium GWF2_54_11]OGF11659.1 MAG: dihydroorotase [Candidatus Edwardsbacteria bacterium GWE2_54_12]OGF17688.1 MAG: dihydroorotase [Candidatus Edwardsbacteria bacterium RIFOXYD12_FULL_50_11]OGJ17095.1 MAG: dihydroorotase [Candidatus Edwardsbacteria bacterium RifOxyB